MCRKFHSGIDRRASTNNESSSDLLPLKPSNPRTSDRVVDVTTNKGALPSQSGSPKASGSQAQSTSRRTHGRSAMSSMIIVIVPVEQLQRTCCWGGWVGTAATQLRLARPKIYGYALHLQLFPSLGNRRSVNFDHLVGHPPTCRSCGPRDKRTAFVYEKQLAPTANMTVHRSGRW